MTQPTRRRPRSLPAPPQPAAESRLHRLRRKVRTKTLRLVDRTINGLYSTASWLDRVAPVERRYYRVAIFGSSRAQPEDELYRQVRELARRLSYMGCDIVTGGGPGLMMAANEGARHGAYRYNTRSWGLTILLPIEEQPNPFLDEVSEHPTFFSRLHQFIRLSHAYIVVDGGIGTTLEAMMVWQLLQVRLLEPRPLVFVGPIWVHLREFVEEQLIARGMASPGDADIVHWVEDIDAALDLVREDRNRFLERHEVILPPPEDKPRGGASPTGTPGSDDEAEAAGGPGRAASEVEEPVGTPRA